MFYRHESAAQPPVANVERLQRGEDDEPQRQQREGAHQRAPERVDLRVQRLARLRHLEPPHDRRAGQAHVAFGDAELLVGELRAVVYMDLAVLPRMAVGELPVP